MADNPRNSSRPTTPPSSPPRGRPATGTKKPPEKPLIQVHPDDLDQQEELVDRVIDGTVRGAPGVGISLALHVIILLVLFLMVIVEPVQEELLLELSMSDFTRVASGGPGDDAIVPLAVNVNAGNIPTVPVPTPRPMQPVQPARGNPGTNVGGVNVGNLLQGRMPQVRNVVRDKQGGSEDAARAISQGLGWLVRTQLPAGNWELHEGYPDAGYVHLRTATGATALALLCFLGEGHTHKAGDFTETVGKGLEWLKSVQKRDGDFHDHTERGRQTAYYAHSQATIALCEAYALTGDESLREPAQRGVDFLVASQQPTEGGWKYQPLDDPESRGDLSVTGWALMALHVARAAGLNVPREALQLAWKFLDSVSEKNGSLYKYEAAYAPDRVTPAMTAEGILCRQFLSWEKEEPAMRAGLDYLQKPQFRPEWKPGRRNVYHWYYATHVFHNMGGNEWQDWYNRVAAEIIPNQLKSGPPDMRGSWNPFVSKNRGSGAVQYGDDHEYGHLAGRLYITCFCILTLEAPYRYLPIYE